MGKKQKWRFANAYRAMEDIGIKEDKVAPVLETLLKLYDKNWALIEEDNYRTLADAIFERDEAEVEEHPTENMDNEAQDPLKEEDQEVEEPERPLKKFKRGYLDGETSSLNTSNTSMPAAPRGWPKEEPDELSETHCTKVNGTHRNAKRKGNQPSSSNSLVHERGDPSQPCSTSKSPQSAPRKNAPRLPSSHSMTLRDRGIGTASPQPPSKNKRPVPRSSSPAIQLKEPKVEPETMLSPEKKKTLKPEDELITGDMPSWGVPSNKSRKGTLHGGSSINRNSMLREDCTPEPTALQSVSERNSDGTVTTRNNAKLETNRGECSSTLAIASSLSGEVNLSLSYDWAPGRPFFHMPSREAVLKSVEDKCIISPKSLYGLYPNTSIMGLMKETCERFLELGTQSSVADVRGANRLVYSRSDAKLPQSNHKKLSSPLNGMNGGPNLNKLYAEDEFVINRVTQGNCAEEMDGQPQLTSQMMRSINNNVDIAKGQEKFAITLVNEVNDEPPPSFCYIRQNAIFQNAYANFSLARIEENNCHASCSGDCLSLSTPCACSYLTSGEFAYTADGLIREDILKECISMNHDPKKHCHDYCTECPLERSKGKDIVGTCKGHLVRNFVKECWIKCGCDIQCGNRVVQRGISRRLQVFMTPEGKGWGLRTLEDLPKGAFVCEYVGEVLTNAELFERVSRKPKGEKHSYPVLLDADWCAEVVLKDEEALCLDATYYGNVARFINHKCDDWNLVEIPVEVETPDHHYYHLAFFTTREVKAMEELTWDYGIDFDDHRHPIKAFRCHCGSESCRDKKSSTRSRRRRR